MDEALAAEFSTGNEEVTYQIDQPIKTIISKPKKPPRVDPMIAARFFCASLPLWSPEASVGMSAHVGTIVAVEVITVTIIEPSGAVVVADDTMMDALLWGWGVGTLEGGGEEGQVEKSVDVGRDVVTGICSTTCESTVLTCSAESDKQSARFSIIRYTGGKPILESGAWASPCGRFHLFNCTH